MSNEELNMWFKNFPYSEQSGNNYTRKSQDEEKSTEKILVQQKLYNKI